MTSRHAVPMTVLDGPEIAGSGRVSIGPTARLRFDQMRSLMTQISRTMLDMTATPVSVERADAALAEIAEQANAARLALRRGR